MEINGTLFFIICLSFLIIGYIAYGGMVERMLRPKSTRRTPAVASPDGVDFLVLPGWKIFLIQLLNIAGLGPVYGAVMGALFGPIALVWIAVGCTFFGAIHDYFSGMMSLRHGGISLPEIIGRYLGKKSMVAIRILCVGLIILVGVVFALGPAELLSKAVGGNATWWLVGIFAYFFAATILPMDAIIGRIYPLFALCLLVMAGGMLGSLFLSGQPIMPGCTLSLTMHPQGIPIWPMMFVTIACGAISGFHATQSPMMARCMRCEKQGKAVFFGPMVAEGVIAMIWCVVGLTFYGSVGSLNEAILAGGGTPSEVISASSKGMLGETGYWLALIGVVILPITTGDTALRSARLMIADSFHVSQKPIGKRLVIALPLLILCIIICQVDFQIIWRYFGWLNQCIACFTLLSISVFLLKTGRNHWITTIPAVILSAVCITYGLVDKYCLGLPLLPSSIGAGVVSLLLIGVVYSKRRKSASRAAESNMPG